MKKILLFILLCCSQINLNATHLPYFDITYKYLGSNIYEFTISMYIDCEALGLTPDSVNLAICSPSGCSGIPSGVWCAPVPGTGQEIYPLCAFPAVTNNCNGGGYPGFQKWVYKGQRTFAMPCDDYFIDYDLCCREAYINTFNGMTFAIGIRIGLDNLNFPGNSTPEFVGEPILYACCNQLFSYNQSAIDPDGDSLVYSFYQPLGATYCNSENTIVYDAGYSKDTAITSSPAMSINSQTGFVTMNPTNCNEVSVLGIKVEEYRNGVLIGYILRDNTIFITNQTDVSMVELESKSDFEIFPNPSNGNFSYSTVAINYSIELFNLTGQLVYSTSEINVDQEINSELAPGIYFYHFNSEENSKSGKIIIE